MGAIETRIRLNFARANIENRKDMQRTHMMEGGWPYLGVVGDACLGGLSGNVGAGGQGDIIVHLQTQHSMTQHSTAQHSNQYVWEALDACSCVMLPLRLLLS